MRAFRYSKNSLKTEEQDCREEAILIYIRLEIKG